MNELWPKYIERAVLKHLIQYTDLPWQIDDDITSNLIGFCEARTDGPWFQQRGKNTWYAEFDINVLIHYVDAKIYTIEEIGGSIMKLLTQSISILDDNQISIGCATPIYDRYRKLQLNKFGKISVDTNAEQATVENRYEINFQGD